MPRGAPLGATRSSYETSSGALEQATVERVKRSAAERQMLRWSESDPDFKAEPAIVEQLAAEMPDEEYESKISDLIERSYVRDVAAEASAADTYRRA